MIVDSLKTKKPSLNGLDELSAAIARKDYYRQVQIEKRTTHFRLENDFDKCIQSPIVENFSKKYENLFARDLSVLGYLFHLFTDRMFFDDLLRKTFTCLDENLNPTEFLTECRFVKIIKNGKIVDANQFYDSKAIDGLYRDYTIMNKMLLDFYDSTFDDKELSSIKFNNPGIEEVDYSNITTVVSKTKTFIQESYLSENTSLNVFDENIIKQFIDEVVLMFIDRFKKELTSSGIKLQDLNNPRKLIYK